MEKPKTGLSVNDQKTYKPESVRTVDDDTGITDAFFKFPPDKHLEEAEDDVDMAVWSFNEQARVLHQQGKK